MSKSVNKCPLVIVEWEDSAQPTSHWVFLSEFGTPSIIRCASVGWLIHDGKTIKALAPNMAEIDSGINAQASGIIKIPSRSIIKITKLREIK